MDSGFYPHKEGGNTILRVTSFKGSINTWYELDLSGYITSSDKLNKKEDMLKFKSIFREEITPKQIQKYCEDPVLKKYMKKGVTFKTYIAWTNLQNNYRFPGRVDIIVNYATCVENGYFK